MASGPQAHLAPARGREEKDLELYRLDLEDRFGRVSEDDPDTLRFFELLKVKLWAQWLAVSEVAVEKGQLKFRLSPDGAVRLPLLGTADGPILQAQRVLAEWAGL